MLAYLREHYADTIRVSTLAEIAEVSVAQLERHSVVYFTLSPQQVLTKLRIEAAMRLLHGRESIAAVGLACGFTDQSPFARQFKTMVRTTPRVYRVMPVRSIR